MRFLDFTKVRDVERRKAQELFGSADEPTELANQVCWNDVKYGLHTDMARFRGTNQKVSSFLHSQTGPTRAKNASTPTTKERGCALLFSTQAAWQRWRSWRRILQKDGFQRTFLRVETQWRRRWYLAKRLHKHGERGTWPKRPLDCNCRWVAHAKGRNREVRVLYPRP